jgi:hypothetical protein
VGFTRRSQICELEEAIEEMFMAEPCLLRHAGFSVEVHRLFQLRGCKVISG